MCEMLASAAHLPDAFFGLAPNRFKVLENDAAHVGTTP
jgi:hypothetical protein